MSVIELANFEVAPGYDGFAVLPEGGENIGLLILPEMFGVTPAMQDAAREFAKAGISTLVPNIFRRSRHKGPLGYDGKDRDWAQERADDLEPEAVCEDVTLAIDAIMSRAPKLRRVAALGHCIGGTYAVTALTKTRLVAAISYYGFGLSRLDALAHLDKPAQLHYALADPHIALSEINAVKALTRGNSNVSVFEYPNAGHSFCNPNRPMYDKVLAQTAHARTLSLLQSLG